MSDMSQKSITEKIKEVGLHSAVFGLGSVAQVAAQFIQIPILTSAFPTKTFGIYSLIQMSATIASAVLYLGMTSAMPRSYFDYQDERDRRGVFSTAFYILLIGACVQILVGMAFGRQISFLLMRHDSYGGEVAIALTGGAISFINQYLFVYLRFQRKSLLSVALSIVTLLGTIGLTMILLELRPAGISAPLIAVLASQAAVLAILLISFSRGVFTIHIIPREILTLIKFGLPTLLTSVAVMLIDWSDRIIIERYLSLGDVGIYSLGIKLGSVVNILLIIPFTQIWSVVMIEYRNDTNSRELFTKITSYFFLAGTFLITCAAFWGFDLLKLIVRNKDYLSSMPIMILAATSLLVYGLTNIVSAGLIYSRRISIFTAVYFMVAVLKIGMNMLTIPAFGIMGAAGVNLVISCIIPAAIYIFARKDFVIEFDWPRLLKMTGFIALGLGYALLPQFTGRTSLAMKIPLFVLVLCALFFAATASDERKVLERTIRNIRTRNAQ